MRVAEGRKGRGEREREDGSKAKQRCPIAISTTVYNSWTSE